MRIIIAIFVLVFTSTALSAQTAVAAKDVPAAVQKKMNSMFPTATTQQWAQDMPGFLSVDFLQDKKKMNATFTSSGGWVSTISYFKKEEYPVNIISIINSNYSGAKVLSIGISETVKEKTYEAHIKQNGTEYELVFDMDANFRMKSRVGE